MVETVYRLRLISKTATNDANDFTASQESKHLLADLVKLDDTSVKLPIGLRGKGVKEINAIELVLKLAYEITRDGCYGLIFQEALEYIEKNLDNPLPIDIPPAQWFRNTSYFPVPKLNQIGFSKYVKEVDPTPKSETISFYAKRRLHMLPTGLVPYRFCKLIVELMNMRN
ncbi:hypothetical protein HK098_000705, partial [Nowakowskiella sp. JEL0407]